MHRFEQDLLFDQLAERNELSSTQLLELTDHVVAFHKDAEIRNDQGGVAAMRWVVEDNMDELSAMSDVFAPPRFATLRTLSTAALENCSETLERRRAEGFVRHCHGDLHLRNICMFENRPTLFDCIEFSDAIACIDTLYDLSFLLMDLDHRGRRDFVNLIFNRYMALTGDTYGLMNLPLFLSCRAAIRAKIAAVTSVASTVGTSTTHEEARTYAELAIDYLEVEPPRLVAVGGQPGCGKSTLAQAIAPLLGPAPGALIIRSDVLRKRRFGRGMFETLPQSCYSADARLKTYADVFEDASAALNAGMSVIVDAVFRNPSQRAAIKKAARQAGIPFTGIWLDAPRDLRADRISGRGPDASDATADLVLKHADM
jgi:predicted kinase